MILDYLKAGYPYLWLVTHEPERLAHTLAESLFREAFIPAWWDVVAGGKPLVPETTVAIAPADPLAPMVWAMQQRETVLFAANVHRFMDSLEYVQAIRNAADAIKSAGSCVVFVGPVANVPIELERLITVIDAPLPDRSALAAVVRQTAHDATLDEPATEILDALTAAASGLTAFEAENSLALSVVCTGHLDPAIVMRQKAQQVKKTGALRMGHYAERFAALGGLEAMKEFTRRALRPDSAVKARGILELGVPGTGKSAFAKALGNEVGRPVLALDLGAVFGSLVGESESRIRSALAVVDAMAPAILFIDEIEKGLAGASASGRNDGGTASRVFCTFLSWLNDHTSDVFVVATCNDISALPPEFTRAERWDALFFIDLPGALEKQRIWELYAGEFGVSIAQRPIDDGWTGAEIKTCCRIAAMLDVPVVSAADYVVPLSLSASEKIDALRQWATGRCLDATHGGRYHATTATQTPAGRRVRRPLNPENN